MQFMETKVKGSFLIELERREDNRGFFARSWCAKEFEAHGLNPRIAQINVGFTAKGAGIRGMHYQLAPHQEAKTVRCTNGAAFDVVVDLRTGSPTYQTLVDATELEYLTTVFYAPESARGVRFDDPAFGIHWPLPTGVISDADRAWPDYRA